VDFQVLYTEPALTDLEEVMEWSWRNHPGTSERFASALLKHVDLLTDFPNLGAPVYGCPSIRRLQHSPFHIYYRVLLESRRVEILHFWHRSRRYSAL
jgi:plasmid stabilization system protein ParE